MYIYSSYLQFRILKWPLKIGPLFNSPVFPIHEVPEDWTHLRCRGESMPRRQEDPPVNKWGHSPRCQTRLPSGNQTWLPGKCKICR